MLTHSLSPVGQCCKAKGTENVAVVPVSGKLALYLWSLEARQTDNYQYLP
jgi:hypothetical protein